MVLELFCVSPNKNTKTLFVFKIPPCATLGAWGLNNYNIFMDNIKTGYDFLDKNDFDSAVNAFSSVVSANPKDVEAHFGLSQAYYFLYKQTNVSSYKKKSKEHANICISLDPKHAQSYAAKNFLSLIDDDNSNKNDTKNSENNSKNSENLVKIFAQTTYDKNHQKEENLNVNSLKDFEKNLPEETEEKSGTTTAVKTFMGFGCTTFMVVTGIIFYSVIKISNSNEEKNRLETTTNIELPKKTKARFSGATISNNGVVVWAIYDKKDSKANIQFTNIDGKAFSKEMYIMDDLKEVFEYNGVVYASGGDNNDKIEARDMKTEKILFDNSFLIQKYPQLGAGIGKIKELPQKGFEIITKDGAQFYYLFVTQKLYSVKEKKDLENSLGNKNEYIAQYLWYSEGNETAKKTYFMAKTLENPFWININASKIILPSAESLLLMNEGKIKAEFEKFPATKKTFLDGELMYGDEDYALVAHKPVIGASQRTLFTCINAKTGEIIWEKTSESNLLFNAQNQDKDTGFTGFAYNERLRQYDLVLFYIKKPTPSIVVLNIKTGQIITEKKNLF